jgi:hypothetical protein
MQQKDLSAAVGCTRDASCGWRSDMVPASVWLWRDQTRIARRHVMFAFQPWDKSVLVCGRAVAQYGLARPTPHLDHNPLQWMTEKFEIWGSDVSTSRRNHQVQQHLMLYYAP